MNNYKLQEKTSLKHWSDLKPYSFAKIHVLDQEEFETLIAEGSCTSLEDLDVKTVDMQWDYAQKALVDLDKKKVLLWSDNIHSQIEENIRFFIEGLKYANVAFELKEMAMLEKDMKQFQGRRM